MLEKGWKGLSAPKIEVHTHIIENLIEALINCEISIGKIIAACFHHRHDHDGECTSSKIKYAQCEGFERTFFMPKQC